MPLPEESPAVVPAPSLKAYAALGTLASAAVRNAQCVPAESVAADTSVTPPLPPMIVAVVMVLQRIEGCSDREAVDRFTYDARWKYAAGGLGFDYPGFVHTVLVDMRARLADSKRPDRIFEVVLEMGRRAGLVGRRFYDQPGLAGDLRGIKRLAALAVLARKQGEIVRSDAQHLVGLGHHAHAHGGKSVGEFRAQRLLDLLAIQHDGSENVEVVVAGLVRQRFLVRACGD